MNTPAKDTIKKIFGNKSAALEFLEETHPKYFGLKSTRSKKIQFLESAGKDVYDRIVEHWEAAQALEWTRNRAISDKGKYCLYHNNPHHAQSLLQWLQAQIDDLNALLPNPVEVNPETFSNEHIKPLARKLVTEAMTRGPGTFGGIEHYATTALLAVYQQQLRQHKNDLAEYELMMSVPTLFPTLRHSSGADLYHLVDGVVVPLDIKTSRWPKFFFDGITHQQAAQLLYERQNGAWFSAEPRTYLVQPSTNGQRAARSSNLPLASQMSRTFTVKFTYKKAKKDAIAKYGTNDFVVAGVRVIFL